MRKIIALLLSCAMALSLSASSGQANAFDDSVFSSLAGYTLGEEDGSWRYEQGCFAYQGDSCLGLGFVAEQETGKELDAPWAWVEYTKNDAAKSIGSVFLKVDGAPFHFRNLDLASDGSYATWNLGKAGQDMLAKLQHAQEIRVTVVFDGQSAEFILTDRDAAGIIIWAQSILSSALYSCLDEQLLLAYDTAYSPQPVTTPAQGGFDQTQFEALEGYMLDNAGEVWRFERSVEVEAVSLYFGIGFVVDGDMRVPLNYPWAWVEYRSARGNEPVSRVKLFIDDTCYTFSSLKLLDGYSCWTLGSKACVIAEKLAKAQDAKVTICFHDDTRDFQFGAAALEPLQSWCDAVSGAQVFALLDQKLLLDFDEIYQVRVE